MNLTSPQSPTLRLRALEPEDLDVLYAWENDATLWSEGETFQPWSREILRKYANGVQDIYTNRQLRLVIETMESQPIGLLDFFDFDSRNRRSGIGILIADESNRGKGFGAETLKIAIEYAFKTLLLTQLYCDILETNTASISLFEKSGFTLSGVKKNWIQLADRPANVRFYQYLKEE